MVDRYRRIRKFLGQIYAILAGYRIYKGLLKQYGDDCYVMVGQHPGTGDVYLQAKFLNAYVHKRKIDNYVFTVIGGAAKSTASLFPIKNLKVLTLKESNRLVSFYRFAGEYYNIIVLHYHPMEMYYGILGYARNYKSLNFYRMMDAFVFDGIAKEDLNIPHFEDDEAYINSIFEEKKLIKGKTVLISPYANSLNGLPVRFWEYLVKQLNKMGYTVCTNSSGFREPPIKGSTPIFVPYKYLQPFLETAGYSICLRSGLCDIISEIPHRRTVIYLKQDLYPLMGGLGSSYEYFSLNAMGLCNDANEYEISGEKKAQMKQALTAILNSFELSVGLR